MDKAMCQARPASGRRRSLSAAMLMPANQAAARQFATIAANTVSIKAESACRPHNPTPQLRGATLTPGALAAHSRSRDCMSFNRR